MTPDEFYEHMKEIFGIEYSEVTTHMKADELMCELLKSLGYEKGIEIFEAASKWYE